MPQEKRKSRLTLPKREEDIQRVVEEVRETHPEMAHEHGHEHEHHHHLDLDEFLAAVEVVLDSLDTRLKNVERQLEELARDVKDLYLLSSKLYKAYLSSSPDERRQAIEEAAKLIVKKVQEQE